MKRISTWPEGEDFSDIGFPDVRKFLLPHYDSVMDKLQNSEFMKDLPVEVSNCVASVIRYSRYTEINVQQANEATLRFVYANPITVMICALNGYMFKVEERVVVSEKCDEEDDDNLYQGVTKYSIADYICYSVRGSGSSNRN